MANGKPKPLSLLKGHRSKAEKAVREKAEKSLLSGISFKEWDEVKLNPIAHKEFMRIKKVFKTIGKDDGLHESVMNRYCLLHSECKEYESIKIKLYADLEGLLNRDMEFSERMELQNKLLDKIMQCDKKIMDKRKALLDIEKENCMTIQSVLRSIPKKPEEPKEMDPMAKLLGG